MARSTTVFTVLAGLIASTGCSLLIDTNPDGVIDKPAVAGNAGVAGKVVTGVSGSGAILGVAGTSYSSATWDTAGVAGTIGTVSASTVAGTATISTGGSTSGAGSPVTAGATAVGGAQPSSSIALGGASASGAGAASRGGSSTVASLNGGAAGLPTAAGQTSGGAVTSAAGSGPSSGGTATGGSATGGVAGGSSANGGVAGGSALPSCTGSTKLCSTACIDVTTDKSNCGECGTACEGYQFCASGKCLPTYVSTRVQPGAASVYAAEVSKDKAHGDLFIEVLAKSDGILLSDPNNTSDTRRVSSEMAFAKYSADGTLIWCRGIEQLLSSEANSNEVSPMFLMPNGDLMVAYRWDEQATNPAGPKKIQRLARISGSNNASVIWDIESSCKLALFGTRMMPRPARGDIITIGNPPNVNAVPNSSVCRIVDQDTTASVTELGPNYATEAAVGADGSTVWLSGRYDGTLAYNPWSSTTWTSVANPPPGPNMSAWPDAFIIGAQDTGLTIGPWWSEGDAGPELHLAVDSTGDLIVAVAGSLFATFNGGQALVGALENALVKIDHATGAVKWRKTLSGVPGAVLVGPSNRVLVIDNISTTEVPFTISIFDSTTGDMLSTLTTGGATKTPAVALGQAELFVVGEVSIGADFNPGTGIDPQGSTPGVFISRYTF
jgi:hypothetical protein